MGISIWQLLIILAIVLVIFGAKRLKNIGTDLGGAIKGFKRAVAEEETTQKKAQEEIADNSQENVFDAEATEKKPENTENKA